MATVKPRHRPWCRGPRWTTSDIPDLSGRRAVITGVTGGLGLATAIELDRHGAELVVTARDGDRATDATDKITAAAG